MLCKTRMVIASMFLALSGAALAEGLPSMRSADRIAFFVDDMAKAVAHLKKHNVNMFGEPTVMGEGPSAGESWMYFLAPWGVQMEQVTYKAKAYEKDFKGKLWNPTAPAQ